MLTSPHTPSPTTHTPCTSQSFHRKPSSACTFGALQGRGLQFHLPPPPTHCSFERAAAAGGGRGGFCGAHGQPDGAQKQEEPGFGPHSRRAEEPDGVCGPSDPPEDAAGLAAGAAAAEVDGCAAAAHPPADPQARCGISPQPLLVRSFPCSTPSARSSGQVQTFLTTSPFSISSPLIPLRHLLPTSRVSSLGIEFEMVLGLLKSQGLVVSVQAPYPSPPFPFSASKHAAVKFTPPPPLSPFSCEYACSCKINTISVHSQAARHL